MSRLVNLGPLELVAQEVPPPPPELRRALDMVGGKSIRRAYFGGGSRIHAFLFVKRGKYRFSDSLYVPVCYSGYSLFDMAESDFINDEVTQVNCLRCLKRLRVISGTLGLDLHRELIDQPQADALVWKMRALRAEAALLRLGVDLNQPDV